MRSIGKPGWSYIVSVIITLLLIVIGVVINGDNLNNPFFYVAAIMVFGTCALFTHVLFGAPTVNIGRVTYSDHNIPDEESIWRYAYLVLYFVAFLFCVRWLITNHFVK